MGTIAGRGSGGQQIDAYEHFARALRLLGDDPARMARSVLYALGVGPRAAQQPAGARRALEQFATARRLSQSIGDDAGIAAADLACRHVAARRSTSRGAAPAE